MSDNVVDMPGVVTMAEWVKVDDGMWMPTDSALNNPQEYRRLVRTQIEELLAMYRRYPLPEFAAICQILTQMQQGYGDVEPFNRPMLAAMDDDDEED